MMLPSWHVVILALAWCLSLGVAFVAGVAAATVFMAQVTLLTFVKLLHRWADPPKVGHCPESTDDIRKA